MLLACVATEHGRLIPEQNMERRTLFLCVSPSEHPPGPLGLAGLTARDLPEPKLSHDPPSREARVGERGGGTVSPAYLAPTDIDQATNIATKQARG